MSRQAILPGLLFVATVLLSAGCGPHSDAPELGEVTGIVTKNGSPAPNTRLEFQPDAGRPSVGRTDAEGRYTLQYTADATGAKIGPHRVRLIQEFPPANAAADDEGTPKATPTAPPVTVPTPVTVEAGENTLNFNLDELNS